MGERRSILEAEELRTRFVPRQTFPKDTGNVYRFVRTDDPEFEGFGEVYFGRIEPDCSKGWHRHSRNVQRFCVAIGTVRITCLWRGEDGKTRASVHTMCPSGHHGYLRIEPGTWILSENVGIGPAVLLNCLSELYDPGEMESHDPAQGRPIL